MFFIIMDNETYWMAYLFKDYTYQFNDIKSEHIYLYFNLLLVWLYIFFVLHKYCIK